MCELALTLHTAAVGTAWSLLSSPQNGLAVLYLFQKHLLYWVYIQSFTADVSETDSHGLAVQAQFFPSYQSFLFPRRTQEASIPVSTTAVFSLSTATSTFTDNKAITESTM
jgi:hypothetical protein